MLRRAGAWCLLVFAWSWAVAGLFLLSGQPAEGYWGLALRVPFLVGPLVASLAWKAWVVREPIDTLDARLEMNGWLVAAWLAPLLLVWASVAVAHLLGWAEMDLSGAPIVERIAAVRSAEEAEEVRKGLAEAEAPYAVLASIQALVFGVLYFAPLAFTEEIGWRGVLGRELKPLGTWASGVVIGVLWGLWLVPLALMGQFFPGDPVRGAITLAAVCIPLGALLTWLRERSGTIWAPSVARGVLTALAGFHELVLRGGDPRATSVQGLAGGIVFLALASALFAVDRMRAARA